MSAGSIGNAIDKRSHLTWQRLAAGLWRFADSCNVYAVKGPEGMLIVNAGTGAWLDALEALPAPPAALALTHFFRDHSAGAARAAQRGIAVHAPHFERNILADPQQHFRERETYIIYDNYWDLFAPIEPITLAGDLYDYARPRLAGLDVEVIPLPGATMGQVGLSLHLPCDGGASRRVVFTGEAIHSPGRVPRVAPYQYNYNDLPGAVSAYASARRLREHGPHGLLPSLGTPMLDGVEACDRALAQLEQNLRCLVATRPGMPDQLDSALDDRLIRVSDHVYRSRLGSCHTWFLISESGKALAIDYGYAALQMPWPNYPRAGRRRPLLHGIRPLKDQFGIDRIDVALISHFHDDHVCGVPLLQRCFGTRCWAGENFAALLEHPEAHCFPCTWPEPIRVDRRIDLRETIRWEEFTFHFAPMSGHTRFAMLIGFEADGRRFVHTGDQYFFQQGSTSSFEDNLVSHNYVYRNGALLDSYHRSAEWLLKWKPHVVLQGHQEAFVTDDAFFRRVADFADHYRTIHAQVMPLGDEQEHLNLDSWGGWIWPYRVHLREPGPVSVTATVRNPLPRRATLTVRLVGPASWAGETARLDAGPREEVHAELTITPTTPCRRQPFAVEVHVDGRPLGQVAEALMTVGHASF